MTSELIAPPESDLNGAGHQPDLRRPPRIGSKTWIGQHREQAASVAALAAFGAVFVFYGFWLNGAFVQTSARMFDIASNTPQLILAIGLVVCLSCQQFDLSVASMAALSATLTVGLYINEGLPIGLVIAIALTIGAAGGLLNGFLVTRLKLNAFIATLGTGGIYAGLTTVYSKGNVVGPAFGTPKLPHWFSGGGSIGDFQAKVPWVVGLALIVVLVLAGLISFNQRFPAKDGAGVARKLLLGAVGVCVVISGLAGRNLSDNELDDRDTWAGCTCLVGHAEIHSDGPLDLCGWWKYPCGQICRNTYQPNYGIRIFHRWIGCRPSRSGACFGAG